MSSLNQLITQLTEYQTVCGDIPVVFCDMDTSWYFPLDVALQQMRDMTVRVSFGTGSSYKDEPLPDPIEE